MGTLLTLRACSVLPKVSTKILVLGQPLQATSMAGMFEGAIVFNQDISSWNVSSVIDMRSMFDGALVFDKDTNNLDRNSCSYTARRYLLECECFCGAL